MSAYPCPNPTCTHAFTLDQVHAAGALQCPACGQVFQFRAHAPMRPPDTRSSQAGPARPEPAKKHVAPPIPVAKPVSPTQAPISAAPRRVSRSRKRYLVVGLAVLAGVAAVVAAALTLKSVVPPDASSTVADTRRVILGNARNQQNVEEPAFKLVLDDKGWASANGIRKRLGAAAAWQSTDKNKPGWFAVAVRDYGMVRPRDGELLRTGIERLEKYFENTLELAEKAEPVQWADEPGQRLLFKGRLNSVTWWGHVYMLAHHGFGYWLYVAAPTKGEAEELFATDLQGAGRGFFLSTARQGWREQPAKVESFTSADGTLTVAAPEGIFEKHPARDQDEHGELFLFAKYQKEQDNRKNADVLVLALAKQADLKAALQTAHKYLEDKKREESADYKIDPAGEGGAASDLGNSSAVGNRAGRVAEYKLLRGATPARFWIVAVVNGADKTYVIRCDATWENRQIWREDFLSLLRAVDMRAKGR